MQNTAAANTRMITQNPPTVVTDSSSTCEPLAPRAAAAASAKPDRSGGRLAAALGAVAGAMAEEVALGETLLIEAFVSAPAIKRHVSIPLQVCCAGKHLYGARAMQTKPWQESADRQLRTVHYMRKDKHPTWHAQT